MPVDHILLNFSLSSDLRELSRLRELIEKKAGMFGLKEDHTYQVVSAVDEICANLIEHDPKKWGVGKIHFKLKIDRDLFELEILDRGGYFDPTQKKAEEPDLENVTKRRRGLGLVMVKKIIDEFSYSRTPQGDNLLILKKYIRDNL